MGRNCRRFCYSRILRDLALGPSPQLSESLISFLASTDSGAPPPAKSSTTPTCVSWETLVEARSGIQQTQTGSIAGSSYVSSEKRGLLRDSLLQTSW